MQCFQFVLALKSIQDKIRNVTYYKAWLYNEGSFKSYVDNKEWVGCPQTINFCQHQSLEIDITSGFIQAILIKGGYPIIFASNVFHNSYLIQKCIQNQQQLSCKQIKLNSSSISTHQCDRYLTQLSVSFFWGITVWGFGVLVVGWEEAWLKMEDLEDLVHNLFVCFKG